MDEDKLRSWQAGVSLLAGGLFAAGWWLLIDGFNYGTLVARDGASSGAAGFAWLPPAGASLFFLMLNGMKWSELSDEGVVDGSTAVKARVFVIFALFVAFACTGGAAFIMIDRFLRVDGSYQWAGISTLVSTLVIVLAALVMRVGTLPPAT